MLEIRRVLSVADWVQAAALLHDYVEWIQAAARIDPLVEQPCFAVELATLAKHYARPDSWLFIAYRGDLAVGTVAVRRHGDGSAELKRLYVRRLARGAGVADGLVARALAVAAGWGCDRIWLESLRGVMDPAIAVYRRNGFLEIDGPGRTLDVEGLVVMECRIDLESSGSPVNLKHSLAG